MAQTAAPPPRTLNEVKQKLNISESQNIEFKEAWRDEYLKWICGFANAVGGKLYIGVNDAHEIVGVADSKRLMEDLPNKIVNYLGIVADVNLLHAGDVDYIEIVVEPSSMPVSYHGQYHYRSGSTKQELKGIALQQFMLKKMNISWDSMVMPSATMNDIDSAAVVYFLRVAVSTGRLPESVLQEAHEHVFRRLHLMNQHGELTIAALLLFGKDIEQWCPTSIFRIGRFGYSTADLIMQSDIVCPLIQMPDRIMQILRSQYLLSTNRYEGLQRIEDLELPKEGLREILCNAIVHKNYCDTYIQMKVFDDVITLWNPGELPENFTVETLLTVHESRPRNQLIARVFYLAGFIESWGRGYEKIRDQFAAMQLAMPTFEVVRGGMMTTIVREKAKSMVSVSPPVAPPVTPQVTPQVKGLLSVLNDGDKSVLEIMDLLELKDRRNFRLNYLQPALSAGLVAMTVPNKPNSRLQRYRLASAEGLSDVSGANTDLMSHDTPKVTPQVTPYHTPYDTPQVKTLLKVLGQGAMNRKELMEEIGLKDVKYFTQYYLQPALSADLVEMTIPDKPKSKNQSYRLTEKGKNY